MSAVDASAFPEDPVIADLPAGLSDKERHEFAFRLMAEQGDRIGDYLFAAIRGAQGHDLQGRWIAMAELVEDIHGDRVTLTYRACDRLAAERAAGKRKH